MNKTELLEKKKVLEEEIRDLKVIQGQGRNAHWLARKKLDTLPAKEKELQKLKEKVALVEEEEKKKEIEVLKGKIEELKNEVGAERRQREEHAQELEKLKNTKTEYEKLREEYEEKQKKIQLLSAPYAQTSINQKEREIRRLKEKLFALENPEEPDPFEGLKTEFIE